VAVGVSVALDVCVGDGVSVAVCVGVAVKVKVAVGVKVGGTAVFVGVAVWVAVAVGVKSVGTIASGRSVGWDVAVTVAVAIGGRMVWVAVGVRVNVAVSVAVGMVGVKVDVSVDVAVAVKVRVGVWVAVSVGMGDGVMVGGSSVFVGLATDVSSSAIASESDVEASVGSDSKGSVGRTCHVAINGTRRAMRNCVSSSRLRNTIGNRITTSAAIPAISSRPIPAQLDQRRGLGWFVVEIIASPVYQPDSVWWMGRHTSKQVSPGWDVTLRLP